MFSGSLCSGFIIVRREDGEWGAPSSIGSAGVGWGLQIGGQLNEAVIGLYSQAAIEAFSGHGQLQLGGELGSRGPYCRTLLPFRCRRRTHSESVRYVLLQPLSRIIWWPRR